MSRFFNAYYMCLLNFPWNSPLISPSYFLWNIGAKTSEFPGAKSSVSVLGSAFIVFLQLISRFPLKSVSRFSLESFARFPLESVSKFPVQSVSKFPLEYVCRFPLESVFSQSSSWNLFTDSEICFRNLIGISYKVPRGQILLRIFRVSLQFPSGICSNFSLESAQIPI